VTPSRRSSAWPKFWKFPNWHCRRHELEPAF
jgi:hypothetical protein